MTAKLHFFVVGATPHVFYEEQTSSKSLKGIFFTTERMRQLMSFWPKVLFIDGTYKLTNIGFVLVLMNCMDTNNYTHVVGCAILADEQADTLSEMFKSFIEEHKKACTLLECIITDKDLTERNVLKQLLVGVKLFLCQFHTLQAMGREITPSKMDATKEEVDLSLRILECMVKTSSEDKFHRKFEELQKVAPPKILLYYLNNHHELRKEWAKCYMIDFTYGQFTNNRTEALNNSIKLQIPLNNDLCVLIHNIFKWIQYRNNKLRHDLGMALFKTKRSNIHPEDSPEYFYMCTLTDHGFKLLFPELQRRQPLSVKLNDDHKTFTGLASGKPIAVTEKTCQCIFYKMHQLPCRHIFRAREMLKLPLSSEDICNERFLKSYYLKSQPIISDIMDKLSQKRVGVNNSSSAIQLCNQSTQSLKETELWKTQQNSTETMNENFKRLKFLFENAHCQASEHDTEHREAFMKKVLDGWTRGYQFELVRIDDDASCATENDEDVSKICEESRLQQDLSNLSLTKT